MKFIHTLSNSVALLAVIGGLGLAQPASAHEGDCPYCNLPLIQNTKDQDNEVVLKAGNKRIEYRCMYCVLKDQGRYKGDLVVYAPSEKVGEPVVLRRTAGKWIAPEGAVFLNTFKKHIDCSTLSRAFSTTAAFDAYVATHKIEGAKALTIAEFEEAVVKPAK